MKNIYKVLGIIALVVMVEFSFTACSNGSTGGTTITVNETNGRLTLSGIVGREGQYIGAYLDDSWDYIACADIDTNAYVTLGRVSGGSVTLKVWQETQTGAGNYVGDDYISFDVAYFTKEGLYLTDDDLFAGAIGTEHIGVQFEDGIGTYSFPTP